MAMNSNRGQVAAQISDERPIAAVSPPLRPFGDGGISHRLVLGRMEGSDPQSLDPFVALVDDVIAPGTGFAMHPHRGIEIVTYLWQGGLAHEDSAGHHVTVEAGGAERIFTGRGVWHSEMPVGEVGTLGLQLWIGLSAADRAREPEFQPLAPDEVPLVHLGAARVRVIAGSVGGMTSPLALHNPTLYLDVTLPAGESVALPVPADYNGLLYVLAGSGRFGSPPVQAGEHQRLVMGPGGRVTVSADAPGATESLRFILLAGRPIVE